jgi:hypothetical protein
MIGLKFLPKDLFHCINTLGRISGLAMEDWVCQKVCFQVFQSWIDSYIINSDKEVESTQRRKEIASTQRKKEITSTK